MAEETTEGGSDIQGTDLRLIGAMPEYYFNGFETGYTLSDFYIRMLADGRPVCQLRMSSTTAKSLATSLAETVKTFEEMTGQPIMTMEEVKLGLEGPEQN